VRGKALGKRVKRRISLKGIISETTGDGRCTTALMIASASRIDACHSDIREKGKSATSEFEGEGRAGDGKRTGAKLSHLGQKIWENTGLNCFV